MTSLLLHLFVPHWDPDSPACRSACGKLAGILGILCNVLLFAGKLAAGLLAGSVSVVADAVNNLSDASSSLVTFLGFRVAEIPADVHHPYGHARMEYLSGLAVAVMILLIGVELLKGSVKKIFHPETVVFTALTVGVLLCSMVVKLWLSRFCHRLGSAIQSAALEATAQDSRNDVLSTGAVLAAGVLSRAFGWQIDGYAGALVALFILYSGVDILKDTVNPLLGAPPDPALMTRIQDTICSYDKVLGTHDLILHDYGPGRRFASAHVEMDSREDPMVCHNIIDNIERDICRDFHIQLVIHYDPIVTDDDELNTMKALVQAEVAALDPRLSIHDFRMVRGPLHTNLIFDLVLPYSMTAQKEELKRQIDQRVQFENQIYYTTITFETQFCFGLTL